MVAALLSTTPRPRARSSTDDFTPQLSYGIDLVFGQAGGVQSLPFRREGPLAVAEPPRSSPSASIIASRGRQCIEYRRA